MLQKKGLVLILSLFMGFALAAGCGGGGSNDDGSNADEPENTSLTVNVDYTGSVAVSAAKYIMCLAIELEDTGSSMPPFCQITAASGTCTIEDIKSSEIFLMVTVNADESSALGSDTGPISADDPWILYEAMNPSLVFADPDNNQPDKLKPADTTEVNVTFDDTYKATAGDLTNMANMMP